MMPRSIVPDVLTKAQATIGEGPVFDRRNGKLVWVDLAEGHLFSTNLETGATHRQIVGGTLGAVAPRLAAAGFAAAVDDGFGLIDDLGLTLVDGVLPEPELRMNDAATDSRGRLWAGSTQRAPQPLAGRLHRWESGAASRVMADGLTLPNGIGFTPDDRHLILADSYQRRILIAEFDADDGEVGPFTTFAEVAVTDGMPDGLAVDIDGCVWVALWGGYEVRRYSPSGVAIESISMPVPKPSSCALDEHGRLVITSARSGLDADALREHPLSGSVFITEVGAPGVSVPPFAG